MEVYIKGMEMPTSCDECRIMVFEDTNCAPELYCGCPIVFKAHPQGAGHRPGYCPLVPVPPHGRLGDLDELYAHLNEWYLTNNPVFTKEEALYIRAMLLGIVEAPTIIPAEPAEEGEVNTDV